MSNLFGVPPPPAPSIVESRPGSMTAPPGPWVDPDPFRRRRRVALLLAFLAVGLLVFANLATWLNNGGVNPDRAAVVAAATYDFAAQSVTERSRAGVATAFARSSTTSPGAAPSTGVVDARITADADAALAKGLDSPAARAAWEDAVAVALTQQQQVLRGGSTPTSTITAQLDTVPVANAVSEAARSLGYTVAPRVLTLQPYIVSIDASSGGAKSILGTLASAWWLLWVGAIGLGAASIAIATRRLRLATIIAIDATLMLGVCLLLIPLFREANDDKTVDPGQIPAVDAAYDALTRSLVSQTLTLMAIAAVSAVVLGVLARTRGRSAPPEPAT